MRSGEVRHPRTPRQPEEQTTEEARMSTVLAASPTTNRGVAPLRALVFAAIIVVFAAACAGDSSPQGGTQTEDNAVGEEQPTDDSTGTTTDASAWDDVVAAARGEGRVVLYTATLPAVAERLQAGFEDAYPEIAVEWDRAITGETITKLDQERETGADGADLTIVTDLTWMQERAQAEELLDTPGPAATEWPGDYSLDGGIVVAGLESYVIAYNTNAIEQPPSPDTAYVELAEGNVGSTIGTTEPGSAAVVAWYEWIEDTYDSEFLDKLAQQSPQLYTGAGPIAQAVGSGEIDASTYTVPSAMHPLMEAGAPVDFIVPNPALGFRYFAAAVENAKRPNAARVFIDWLMTEDGQTAMHGLGTSASPLSGISGSLDASAIEVIEDMERYDSDYVNEFTERFNATFQ